MVSSDRSPATRLEASVETAAARSTISVDRLDARLVSPATRLEASAEIADSRLVSRAKTL